MPVADLTSTKASVLVMKSVMYTHTYERTPTIIQIDHVIPQQTFCQFKCYATGYSCTQR